MASSHPPIGEVMSAKKYPHVNAAFINALREEGSREEILNFLQKEWNENCYLRAKLHKLEKLVTE